tara:strand:+ start:152 stop:343 length:192 start_codon:yes stop_codon:yes gene_type:complete
MSKEKIIFETVETIIDSIYDTTTENMLDYGNYEESSDSFDENREELVLKVIEELNDRVLNMDR